MAPDSSYWAAPHGDHGGRHRTLPLRDRWSRHALTRIVCCCGRAWCQGVPGAKAPASTCCCSRCRAGWRRAPPHQRRQARCVDRRNAPTLTVARRIVCRCGCAWCQGVPGAKSATSTGCCSRCRAGWRRSTPPHQRRQARRVDRRNAPTLAVARRSGRACCGRATTGGESC